MIHTPDPLGAIPHRPASPAGDHPPASPPVTFVPVRAVEDILAERFRQIHDFGHTAEADKARNLDQWVKELEPAAHAIAEGIHCGQRRDVVRRRLVKHAALCAALIDRLDADAEEWADVLERKD